jgi:hypothetical protein
VKNANTKSSVQSINPGPRTFQYATTELPTALLLSEIISEIGSILKWRRRSIWGSIEISKILGGENVSIETTQEELSLSFYPDANGSKSAISSTSRILLGIQEDQSLSKYPLLGIISNRKYKNEKGEWRTSPTKISYIDFLNHYGYLQDKAVEIGFPDWALRNRKHKQRGLVAEYLKNYGAKIIDRKRPAVEKSHQEIVEELRRQPNELTTHDLKLRMESSFEDLLNLNLKWANSGLKETDFWREFQKNTRELEQRSAFNQLRNGGNGHGGI